MYIYTGVILSIIYSIPALSHRTSSNIKTVKSVVCFAYNNSSLTVCLTTKIGT